MDLIVIVSKFRLMGGDLFAFSDIVERLLSLMINLSLNNCSEKFRIFLNF
jgi:hypothetical protein